MAECLTDGNRMEFCVYCGERLGDGCDGDCERKRQIEAYARLRFKPREQEER